MTDKIFINYRREDSIGTAGRLHDRLAQAFGEKNLFMDVDSIPAGVDFVADLNSQLAACRVFLAIIGPSWLDAKDESGARRLDNPDDFVTIEIAAALARDIRVIPVLVDSARMPKVDKLPESIRPLVRRNAVEVRNSQFRRDAETLIARMREALAPTRLEALGEEAAKPLRWRVGTIAGVAAVAVLLLFGWGGYAYFQKIVTTVERTVQQQREAELKAEQERQARAAADAEEKRKAELAEQQRITALKAEQERQARAAADAEEKRKAELAEQQRIAALKTEQEWQARAAADAEKRKAELAAQQRIAALKAEQERQARAAADAEKRKAELAEQQRIAALKAEQERQARAAAEADAKRKADEAERARVALKTEEESKAKAAAEAEARRKAAEVKQQPTPWTKVCGKSPDTNNKQVCVTGKDSRLENGTPAASVALIEAEGEGKLIRVTVPLGMQLTHGTRLLIDQSQPAQSPYIVCFPAGCMADHQVTDDLIARMKKGQKIIVQAINLQGTPISLTLPLNDFAKAYDGPPTDPKVYEQQHPGLSGPPIDIKSGDLPNLIYSPWTKVCGKRPDTNNKQVCVTGKDGRLENGTPAASVALMEAEGEGKLIRVTVPLGMQLTHGTRLLIDQSQPAQSPYIVCFPAGCMADHQVTDDLIARMKKGQKIIVQAINLQGTPISLTLPLNDFAKAYDGPPTDPKVR